MASASQPSACSSSAVISKYSETDLKYEYLQLLDDVSSVGQNFDANENMAQLEHIIDQGDALISKVKSTGELFLDAKVLHSATTTMENITTSFDVGEGNFRLLPFAEKFKVKATNRNGKTRWAFLANFADPIVSAGVPSWAPLLGSFEFSVETRDKEVEKKKRVMRPKDKIMEKKEPEKLNQMEKQKDGVEEIVQMIFSRLRRLCRANQHRPINYFRFVINPDSYPKSVENIFHVSFLINDGHAQLELVDGEPFISPVTKGKENSNPETQTQPRDKKQDIISIDMQSWQDLIDALEIKEAMIELHQK